jgi:putative peptidoglycan lipid II flippase
MPAVTAAATTSSRQILRAATLVMALFMLSRVTGLVREMVIGARFGTSAELDAYLAAFRVPDLLFQLVAGGALGSAFIPVFTGCLTRRDLRGAWRLFSAVTNLVLLIMTGLAAVVAVAAPLLVRTLLAPGFTPAQQALTVSLMRWMLISTIVFGVSGIMMGVLNSFQHFLLPALSPVLYNLSIIAGAWFLGPEIGVYGLVIGVVVGAFLHLDAQIIGVWWRRARYRLILGLSDANVREVGRLMGPRVLGLAAVQLNFWINTLLASSLSAGSISALNYAWLLMLLPQGIVAQAVATAAFPTFAALEARGRLVELRTIVSQTLRAVLFLAIPAAVGLFVWRTPLVRMLLERGEFTATSTDLTAYALAFYAFGLVGHSLVEIAARAFYALHDTRTPVLITFGGVGLNILLSLLLLSPLGFGGLAAANTLATLVEMALMVWLLAHRLGGLEWPQLRRTAARSALAAAAMALPLLALADRWRSGSAVLFGLLGLIVAAAIYLAAAALLRMPEVRVVRRLIGR